MRRPAGNVSCRVSLKQLSMMMEDVLDMNAGADTIDKIEETAQIIAEQVSCVYRRRTDDMTALSEEIEEAQAALKAEAVKLQEEIKAQEQQIENLEKFIQRVKRDTTLTELTSYALRELIRAVYVETPDKSSGKRKQGIHVEYDLVGFIPVEELMKAEQA